MSDFFDEKNYNDYFEKLNSRIQKSGEKSATPIANNRHRRKKKKGIYKTIRIRKSVCLALAFVLLIGAVAAITAAISDSDKKEKSKNTISSVADTKGTGEAIKKENTNLKISFKSDSKTKTIPETSLTKNLIVVRRSDFKVVAQKDAHDRIFPASTMKIMTLLVAVENIKDFNDTFTITYEMTDPIFKAQGSTAGFLNDETVTVNDLLYGLILPSGGDAAMGLAFKIAGGEEEFVKMMNEKAKELGLLDTHFTNSVGLYDEENYSSAYDMAVILEAALKNETCRKILSTKTYTTSVTAQHPNGIVLVSNLYSRIRGNDLENISIMGGKTGYVDEAGHCVASFGKNDQTKEDYIVVTMGNDTRNDSTEEQLSLYETFVK